MARVFREFTLEGRPSIPGALIIPRVVEDRFLARLPPLRAPDACWDLARCVSSPLPEFPEYTQLQWRVADRIKYSIPAHRFSYLRHHGSISPNLMALHRCHRKACVNPAHVYEGTEADNEADKKRDPVLVRRHLERVMQWPTWRPEVRERAIANAARFGITCEAVRVSQPLRLTRPPGPVQLHR